MSKQIGHVGKTRHAKTDIRYWEAALYHASYRRGGTTHRLANWSVKIQHGGRREVFSLHTPNRAAAAARAKQIYLSLQSSGWDATLAQFKPRTDRPSGTAATVGEFLKAVVATAGGKPKTIEGYCRAFRTIVSNIFGIDGGAEKYDYRTGGRERWLARINALRLRDVTPDRVQKWKVAFLRRSGTDPVKQRAARISVNSLMRQAKSLFAPDIVKFIRLDIDGTPFDGVSFEDRPSMRYRSSIDVQQLIAVAQDELPEEQLKAFLLAVMVGLRRNEIDKLEWPAFLWTLNIIRIQTTQYLQPKSEDSSGDVDVDPELMAAFRTFYERAKSSFVIESDVLPRMEATYSHYRCERHFGGLTKWLRAQGVSGNRPLHTLRKEFGSLVCDKHGIYAAMQALRHSDIAITSEHYTDRAKRATTGLGSLLKWAGEIPGGPQAGRRG